MDDDKDRLFHEVRAADVILSREVSRRGRPISPQEKVAAVERGVRFPDGTVTYERIEFTG